jgi:hypothetical protein
MTIDVDLQCVVDLTDDKNCDALGLHPGDLITEWRALLAESKIRPFTRHEEHRHHYRSPAHRQLL